MNNRLSRLQKELEAIDDPQDKAKELSDVLAELPKLQGQLRALRQEVLTKLHVQDGMSFGQIGALLSITRGRVKQIVDGQTVSGRYLKKQDGEGAPTDSQ